MRASTLMSLAIFLMCFSLGSIANAQNTGSSANSDNVITLEDAITIALENNYTLKQAQNNLDLAKTEVKSAKMDLAPSLSASMSGSRNIGRQFNTTTGQIDDQATNSFSSSVGARVTLFDGFRNIQNLRRSEVNEKYTQKNLERTREDIIFNTASSFLQVLLDQRLLTIAQENLEASQKQLEQVKAQVEVGARPSVDLYNQESTVANNELEVIRRENTLAYNRIDLIRLLRMDPLKDYEFDDPEIEAEKITAKPVSLEQMVQQALQNRSDLRAQELLIQTRKHDLNISKAGLYPTLSFDAGVSSRYNDRLVSRVTMQSVSFNDQFFDQNINRSLSLSLNIPIFSNFNNKLNIERSEVNLRNAQLTLEDQKLGVQQEVRQAYNDYIALAKELESTQKALRAAQRTYETQQERYKVGASTLIELSQANASFVEAQSNRARTIINFIFQEKLLDYYLGKLDANLNLDEYSND
ncbi:MAG: TolC family protein [Bacteroidota bacterium]